ncbi:hypothetical protein EJ08DRAFT_158100 [Tothia fuscella]|uniref:Uncharacterized protein n=1 Tax=Tothia fuscella TaxID=1048955 RepID=A0A9P4U0I8_9PEZI|nr:hypothetical protein EJ08DRAFT_158100 [Tothia fuscella]
MDHPYKRQKLSREPEKMARKLRQERRGLQVHRRQAVVVTEVALSVTENVSIDIDTNGVPTSTTTIAPTNLPAAATSAVATTVASSSVPGAASVVASSSPITAATPSPSRAASTAIGISSSASTPKPASVLSTVPSSVSATAPSSSILNSSNPVASSGLSSSGIVSAAGLGVGFNSSSSSSTLSSSLSPSSSSLELLSSSSPESSPLSSTLSSSSITESITSATPFVAPGVGVGTGATDPSSVPSGHSRNGTAKAPNSDGASPPVVAGAVVGSVGGMAVLLLLLVLVARWYKHHSRSVKYGSHQGDSATDLTPHGSLYPPPRRRSFLPAGAAAFINRMSGSHRGSVQPTLPDVQEHGFQKVAGRKLPSQFPSGMDEGPVEKDFEKTAAEATMAKRMRGVTQLSPSSSYYRDSNDTTQFFSTLGGVGEAPTPPPPLFATSSSEAPSPEAGPSNYQAAAADKEIIRPSPAKTPNITSSVGPFFRDFASPEPDPIKQQHYSPRPGLARKEVPNRY